MRKWKNGTQELFLFATEGFAADHEGISIYYESDSSGFIMVSDQDAGQFHVFSRRGEDGDLTIHPLLAIIPLSTQSSDGSETISYPLPPHFPSGLFVAMSEDKILGLSLFYEDRLYYLDAKQTRLHKLPA
jgi:3-phytase